MFAKKNVVAAAALTLLAVAAHAQVTVYGNLDVSVGRKQELNKGVVSGDKYAKDSRTAVDSNDMTDSFIGFKGQEDLGGGLKAVFKLESQLALDSGATEGSTFWNRNAYVGLAGDFGALNLGQFENLFKLEGGAFNPFGNSRTFSATDRNTIAGTDSWSNGIGYVSPNLGGLTLSAQYSAREQATATPTLYSAGAYAVSANFVAGPLALSAVYGDVRNPNVTTGSIGSAAKARSALLGVSYDFGVVKLFGQYSQDKFTVKTLSGESKGKFYQIGAAIPVTTDGAVLVSYGDRKDTTDGLEGADKIRSLSLGYTHNLSKRTNVYGALINERTTDGLAQAPDLKGTTNSFAVGVRHAF